MRDEKIQTKKHKAYGIGTTTHELWQVGMETGGKLLKLNKNTHFNDSNMGDVSSLHSQHIPTLSITSSSNTNQSFQRFDTGDFSFLFIQQIIPHCRCAPRPIKTIHFNDSNMGDLSSLHSQHIPTLSITSSSNRNQSFQRFDSGGFLFPLHSSFGFAHIIILGDSEKVPTS